MKARSIIGAILLLGAVACLAISQRDFMWSHPGYFSKLPRDMMPSREIPLTVLDHAGYLAAAAMFGIEAVYCLASLWLRRRRR